MRSISAGSIPVSYTHLRVIVKTFFEALNFDGTHSANVCIYCAKEAGVNIAKALRVNHTGACHHGKADDIRHEQHADRSQVKLQIALDVYKRQGQYNPTP